MQSVSRGTVRGHWSARKNSGDESAAQQRMRASSLMTEDDMTRPAGMQAPALRVPQEFVGEQLRGRDTRCGRCMRAPHQVLLRRDHARPSSSLQQSKRT